MKSTQPLQYTIRAIPPKLDAKLRADARASGQSLNDTLIASLAKGAGISLKTETFHDLDWFCGAMSVDTEFDAALKWLDTMPTEDSR